MSISSKQICHSFNLPGVWTEIPPPSLPPHTKTSTISHPAKYHNYTPRPGTNFPLLLGRCLLWLGWAITELGQQAGVRAGTFPCQVSGSVLSTQSGPPTPHGPTHWPWHVCLTHCYCLSKVGSWGHNIYIFLLTPAVTSLQQAHTGTGTYVTLSHLGGKPTSRRPTSLKWAGIEHVLRLGCRALL